MKLTSIADLFRRSSRELMGMTDEIRKDLGNYEQQRRRDYNALENIRKVPGQRRIQRPNL